jgi:hypothetical protein
MLRNGKLEMREEVFPAEHSCRVLPGTMCRHICVTIRVTYLRDDSVRMDSLRMDSRSRVAHRHGGQGLNGFFRKLLQPTSGLALSLTFNHTRARRKSRESRPLSHRRRYIGAATTFESKFLPKEPLLQKNLSPIDYDSGFSGVNQGSCQLPFSGNKSAANWRSRIHGTNPSVK